MPHGKSIHHLRRRTRSAVGDPCGRTGQVRGSRRECGRRKRRADPQLFSEVRLGADDRLYLLYTAPGPRVRATTQAGARATAGLLRERVGLPPEQTIVTAINDAARHPDFDPANHALVLRALRERVREILASEPQDADLRLIYSSGTPQMQTAWLLLVNAGVLRARLFRAEGEEVHLEPLFEDQLLAQACRLFASAAFRPAAVAFEDLARRSDAGFAGVARERRTLFNIMTAVAEAFQDWSGFAYAAAQKRLTQTIERCDRFRERQRGERAGTPTLDALRESLAHAAAEVSRLRDRADLRVLHVYRSAHELCERGQLLDAIWRFEVARDQALVAAAIAALRESFGAELAPDNFRNRLLGSRARREIVRACYGGNADNIPPHLRGEAALDLLESLRPKLARQTRAFDLDGLRRIWWHTIHRAAPVDRNDAYRSAEETRRYLRPLVGDPMAIDYPLAAASLGRLADLFAAAGAGRP